MPSTPRMNWVYPGRDTDPWFDPFETFVESIDASSYANREDRSLILGRGGNITFTASNGELSWSDAIEIYSTISGFKLEIPAGSASLEDGQVLYAELPRAPTSNSTLEPKVSNSTPNTDDAYPIAIRRNDSVFFRFGTKLDDGESLDVFELTQEGTDIYERVAEFEVVHGSSTADEATLGRILFDGSLIGVSAEITDPVTDGSVQINVKVNNDEKITIILDTNNPSHNKEKVSGDEHPVSPGDSVTVEVVTDNYDNDSNEDAGLIVHVALLNGLKVDPSDIPDASKDIKGVTRLSEDPDDPDNPVAVGDNDNRIFESRRFLYEIKSDDGEDFTVNFSPGIGTTEYIVLHTLASVSNHVTVSIPTTDREVDRFRVNLSASLSGGDTIYFCVMTMQ